MTIADYLFDCGLDKLSKLDNYKWIARCPICGDSKTHLNKRRFYILLRKEQVFCHNCHYTNSIKNFIKEEYPEVYKQYVSDLIGKNKFFTKEEKLPIIERSDLIKLTNTATFLNIGKKYGLTFNIENIIFIYRYLVSRNLNPHKFGYIDDFFGLQCEILGTENKSTKKDPRLVIPFIKKDTKEIYAVQGRALLPDQRPKYLTLILNEKYGKLYNYFNVNPLEPVYVCEGPIDSMFLNNSIALSGSNVNNEIIDKLKKFKKCIIVYDNDILYNKDIKNMALKMLNAGFSIYIPPSNINAKDINEMSVKLKMSNKEIIDFIDKNTFTGITAKIKLSIISNKKDII